MPDHPMLASGLIHAQWSDAVEGTHRVGWCADAVDAAVPCGG